MTKNQSIDKNSIKMAKMLLEKAYSQDEITSALKIRPSTFFKNLHLLEMAGFKIQKESGKYGIIVFKNRKFLKF